MNMTQITNLAVVENSWYSDNKSKPTNQGINERNQDVKYSTGSTLLVPSEESESYQVSWTSDNETNESDQTPKCHYNSVTGCDQLFCHRYHS